MSFFSSQTKRKRVLCRACTLLSQACTLGISYSFGFFLVTYFVIAFSNFVDHDERNWLWLELKYTRNQMIDPYMRERPIPLEQPGDDLIRLASYFFTNTFGAAVYITLLSFLIIVTLSLFWKWFQPMRTRGDGSQAKRLLKLWRVAKFVSSPTLTWLAAIAWIFGVSGSVAATLSYVLLQPHKIYTLPEDVTLNQLRALLLPMLDDVLDWFDLAWLVVSLPVIVVFCFMLPARRILKTRGTLARRWCMSCGYPRARRLENSAEPEVCSECGATFSKATCSHK